MTLWQTKLADLLQNTKTTWDTIVIDTPPSLGALSTMALNAAHGVQQNGVQISSYSKVTVALDSILQFSYGNTVHLSNATIFASSKYYVQSMQTLSFSWISGK
jgi:cellulose biosynthesis protein BcsQ